MSPAQNWPKYHIIKCSLIWKLSSIVVSLLQERHCISPLCAFWCTPPSPLLVISLVPYFCLLLNTDDQFWGAPYDSLKSILKRSPLKELPLMDRIVGCLMFEKFFFMSLQFSGATNYKNLASALHISGTKHQSHQDYMEKANKARSERLSSGQSSSLKEWSSNLPQAQIAETCAYLILFYDPSVWSVANKQTIFVPHFISFRNRVLNVIRYMKFCQLEPPFTVCAVPLGDDG